MDRWVVDEWMKWNSIPKQNTISSRLLRMWQVVLRVPWVPIAAALHDAWAGKFKRAQPCSGYTEKGQVPTSTCHVIPDPPKLPEKPPFLSPAPSGGS